MKRKLIFVIVFVFVQHFIQETNVKAQSISVDTTKTQNRDTTLRVIYANRNKSERRDPAIFINGKHVMQSIFIGLSSSSIENIELLKQDTLINNISYQGQIKITTKGNYVSKPISLTGLKNKYTDFKDKPVVFMLDGNFIKANYDSYIIDENSLLTIIVDELDTSINNEKIKLGLIKLDTKTEENIKKRNQIMIRGSRSHK